MLSLHINGVLSADLLIISTHFEVVEVVIKFSILWFVKNVKEIVLRITVVMDDSSLFFILDKDKHFLIAKLTQFYGLF